MKGERKRWAMPRDWIGLWCWMKFDIRLLVVLGIRCTIKWLLCLFGSNDYRPSCCCAVVLRMTQQFSGVTIAVKNSGRGHLVGLEFVFEIEKSSENRFCTFDKLSISSCNRRKFKLCFLVERAHLFSKIIIRNFNNCKLDRSRRVKFGIHSFKK
jgi:hypothetical protein